MKNRVSARIKATNNLKITTWRWTFIDLVNKLNLFNLKDKICAICELYEYMILTYELVLNNIKDYDFNIYMNTIFYKGLFLKNQFNIYLNQGYKIKMKYNIFVSYYNKLNKKVMNYYYSKIDALGCRIKLNDDVILLIYSYIV
jgi:hypothetical protein